MVSAFRDWLRVHRGASEPTLRQYCRGAAELIDELGADVVRWNAQSVRDFLLGRAAECGPPTTQKLITSLRAFLRYVSFAGESRDDLALAVPAVASWRLARLPRCLSEDELARVIAACDGATRGRLRDRAIVLLLSRLGPSNSPYRETPHKAGVVADLVGPAAFATQDMAAQCRTAALLDGRHDLELAQAQVTLLSPAPGGSMEAQDVGDFQGGA
jgi:hypothetical protein